MRERDQDDGAGAAAHEVSELRTHGTTVREASAPELPRPTLTIWLEEKGPETSVDEIKVGSRWKKSLLGTEAVYEVVAVDDDTVLVAVITAPRLPAGVQFQLTRGAFASMERLDPR